MNARRYVPTRNVQDLIVDVFCGDAFLQKLRLCCYVGFVVPLRLVPAAPRTFDDGKDVAGDGGEEDEDGEDNNVVVDFGEDAEDISEFGDDVAKEFRCWDWNSRCS